jgi:hypothetical protein
MDTPETNEDKLIDSRQRGRRKGRLRRIVVIALAGLFVLVAAAPYLIPQEYLRQRIASELSQKTQMGVTLDLAKIGWFSGLRLSGLILEDNKARTRVAVERMKMPLEPFKLIFRGSASYVRLEGVRVELAEQEQPSKFNLFDTCPGAIPVQRVQLSDLKVDFTWRDGFRQNVAIPWLEFIFDLSKQTVQYDAQAKLQAQRTPQSQTESVGRLTTHGNFKFVQQEGQQCLAGTLNVNWQELDLSILRLEQVKEFDLEKLVGRSGGNLNFEIFPDFHFRWNSQTQFDGLVVKRRDIATPGKINRLTVRTDGNFDPVTGNLTLKQLDVSSSPLKISSTMAGRFDEEDFDLKTLDLNGRLDMAVVAALTPGLAKALRENGKIDGPCLFNFSWKGEPVGYQIKASIDADRVSLDKPGTILKRSDDTLNWSVSVHTDQATWPWVVLDSFDFKVGQTQLHASGRLPPVRNRNNLDAWVDEVRRLAELSVTVNSPEVVWFTPRVPAVGEVLTSANLSGPVTMHLAYTGQEDVGRVDVDLDLKESSTLGIGDVFVKPKNKKIDLRFQGFWPWQTRQPQMWIYAFGKCGDAEFLTDERPMKVIWAFGNTADKKPMVDLFGDVSIEVRGIDQIIACSPRLQRQHMAEHVGGTFEFQSGNVLRVTLDEGRWNLENARVHFELEADKTWADLPETFLKPADVPMSLMVDYTYGKGTKQHELTGKVNWLTTQAELDILRIEDQRNRVKGRGEVRIDNLKKTLAAVPGISKKIKNVAQVDGGVTLELKWSNDIDISKIDWALDATEMGVVVKGETVKPAAMPATVVGQVTLPARQDGFTKTYVVSKLRSQLGRSYVNLGQGSMTLRNIPGSKWDKMLGVEPWMFWYGGPMESFSLDLAGHVDAESPWLRVHPKLGEVLDHYGLKGHTDFNLEAGLANSLLQTTFTAKLDEFAFRYENLVKKESGTPGSLRISIFAWPDSDDSNLCHFQIAPATLQMGEIYTSCNGGGEFKWSRDNNFQLNDALARVDLKIANVAQLNNLSPMIRDYRAGGRINAHISLSRQNEFNHLSGSFIEFDNVNAEVSNQPVMLDGRISFAEDYINSEKLLFSAGVSSMRLGWDMVLRGNKLTGVANIASDYFDTDQVQQTFIDAVKARRGAVGGVVQPSPLPEVKPTDLAYQLGQEDLMKKFQPWRQKLINSSVLANLDIKKLRMTDPRTGDRHDLDSFRSQVNVEHNPKYDQPTAGLRFWSRISDGLISGNFVGMLNEENPTLILESNIDNIRMVDEFRSMVENFFPGLRVESRITITENSKKKLFTTRETAPNYQVGQGNMVFVDGFMIGKAGPDWITRIFPGLNFTRYNFIRMYNWFEKKPNGVVHNNMIFVGRPWNIYIEGNSFPDGRIEYEVGVDLLARYESEYWSSLGQGRVPIFVTSARVVAGKMEDQITSYVPPHEVIYRVLVKNNAIAGAYRLLRKNRP